MGSLSLNRVIAYIDSYKLIMAMGGQLQLSRLKSHQIVGHNYQYQTLQILVCLCDK